MEMGLPLFYAFSLLLNLASVAFAGDNSTPPCSSQFNTKCKPDSSGLHLTLYHPRNPHSPASISDVPISTILSHDEARVKSLAYRLSKIPSSRPTSLDHHLDMKSVSDPLTPGGSVGLGNYVTQVGIGTPAASYVMVVDTGSSLSWIQCRPCAVSCHAQVGTVFNPKSSTSYHSIPCSANECTSLRSATLNPSACSSSNVCIYQASYGDSSFSLGYLSKDTLSFGSNFTFPNFTYGCGQDNEGLFGKSAGLIGLARNKLSLLSQVAPKLGYAFTYCLPTTKSTGYLSMGSYNPAGFSYTPLVSSSLDDALHFLKLTYISVAGKPIAVPASSYSRIPTIMDSGTVITRLQSDVYTALSKAFLAAMKGHKKVVAYSILDTCFEGKVASTAVPTVALVFDGGATMNLRPESIIISLNSAKLTCLAFAPATRVSIIGNTQQQTFKVVYDVAQKKIGFASGGCR
ncbi:Eukaryotic aspartyl protease family protein [Rhynchospora pubera]|uniref:Eukaryotic aspartyl protease family protein n=1 Tax=Rhynchospora pubera TaxID=906938 RepID=A0AAV8G9E1_9POAL|nr:Eukaryotic aspartyl protease family protein [Rhynchospora pubera]